MGDTTLTQLVFPALEIHALAHEMVDFGKLEFLWLVTVNGKIKMHQE